MGTNGKGFEGIEMAEYWHEAGKVVGSMDEIYLVLVLNEFNGFRELRVQNSHLRQVHEATHFRLGGLHTTHHYPQLRNGEVRGIRVKCATYTEPPGDRRNPRTACYNEKSGP